MPGGEIAAARRGAAVGLLCLALGIIGCGTPVGQVTGKVTHHGSPVAEAQLVFRSTAKSDDQFFGLSDQNGTYHVSYRTYQGLPVGDYEVTVTWHTLPGGKPLPPGETGRVLKETGKAVKHEVVFQKQISRGTNAIDLELNDGKKKSDG